MALAVPEDKSYEVVADVYGQSALLQLADVRPMTSAVEDHVIAGDFVWPAGMENVAEGAAKPTVDGGLDSYQIVANKMAVFVIVTDELLAESAVDIVAYYQDAISQRMSQLIDVHGIHGGGPFGTESLTGGAANTVTIGTGVDLAEDFNQTLAAVENADHAPSGFLSARRLKSQLRGLRSTTNDPIYVESLTADAQDQIYGEPIYYIGRSMFSNNASQAGPPIVPGSVQAIAGDFSRYIIGLREQLTFSLHNEGIVDAINLLETNQTALRAEMRLGGKVTSAEAFALLRNA